jgi:hypothetical protein
MYGERLLVNARSLDILIPNVRCFPRTGAYRFGLLPYDGADLLGGAEFVTESRLVVIFARTMAPEQAGVPAGRAPSRRVLCSSKRHPRPERVNAGPEAKGRDGGARHLPTVNEAEIPARQRRLAGETAEAPLLLGLRCRFDILMGNFVVFALLIWSISWFYLPIDCSISRYSPRKIAT